MWNRNAHVIVISYSYWHNWSLLINTIGKNHFLKCTKAVDFPTFGVKDPADFRSESSFYWVQEVSPVLNSMIHTSALLKIRTNIDKNKECGFIYAHMARRLSSRAMQYVFKILGHCNDWVICMCSVTF